MTFQDQLWVAFLGPDFQNFFHLLKKRAKKICYLKSSFHFNTSIKVSTISKMSLFLATGVWKNLLALCPLNSLNFWGLISWRERGFISKSKAAYLPKKPTSFGSRCIVWIFFQFLWIWNYLKYSQQVSHSLPFTYPGFIMQWLNILPVVIPRDYFLCRYQFITVLLIRFVNTFFSSQLYQTERSTSRLWSSCST